VHPLLQGKEVYYSATQFLTSFQAFTGEPMISTYSSTKFAVRGLTQAAGELIECPSGSSSF
jgi:hypothetical protein